MPKYKITMNETVRQTTDLIIEADNEDQARSLALEYENIEDSYTYGDELVDFEVAYLELYNED